MFYLKWGFRLLILALLGGFLHYTLPQTDIARITNTDVRRIDYGQNSIFWASPSSNQTATGGRDVYFIDARLESGKVMVYRNEDTGWGWPPYFKLDSSNVQAEASDRVSTQSDPDPQWVAIKHYGWRNEWLSIYPNAVSIRPVAGPEVSVFPWTATIILVILLAVFWAIYARWRRFWAKRVDPVMLKAQDRWESVDDDIDGYRGFWTRLYDAVTFKRFRRKRQPR